METPAIRDRTRAPVDAARMLPCSLCWAASGTPCQQSPEADHLARYLDAYANGKISRKDMTAVFAAAEVITAYRLVTAAAVAS
jgi:hypothetical protein